MGPFSNVTKVTGNLVWTPANDGSSPTFGDTKSNFFRPVSGEITVAIEFENRGWEGTSSCKGSGQKTFPVERMTPGALRHMLLEIAEDGRYKLTLVIPDTPDPFPRWEFESTCTWPNVAARDRVPVHSVSVVLGRQQGVVDEQQGIVGQLPAPIRRGPRTTTGSWSFKSPER
jgi:hypothetical protein